MQSDKPHYRTAMKAALVDDTNQTIQRAMQLQELDRKLREHLPEPLASNVRLGNIRDGKLIFLADSVAWTRRLLEKSAVLLEAAHAAGIPASDVTVKMAMNRGAISAPEPEQSAPPSHAARDAFRVAASLTDDEDLKARLLQLAAYADDSGSL